MPRHTLRVGLSLAALLLISATARAQSPEPRAVLSISGGVQSVTGTLSDHFETPLNAETETVDVKYSLKPDLLVDAGIGVRLWAHLGAGLAVSRATGTHSADIEASIPHPFFFERPRAVSGTEDNIVRNETGVHVQLQYAVRAGRSATLVLGAGPSWISVEQELVTAIKFDETFPFDVATFSKAVTTRAKASAAGYNVGADLRWMLTPHVGFGGLVRFTRATVDLPAHDTGRISVSAGGVQGTVGLRVGF
ncbi:MAG: outer membrane beta-barrel protein [Acidobacteriota bacterium]